MTSTCLFYYVAASKISCQVSQVVRRPSRKRLRVSVQGLESLTWRRPFPLIPLLAEFLFMSEIEFEIHSYSVKIVNISLTHYREDVIPKLTKFLVDEKYTLNSKSLS